MTISTSFKSGRLTVFLAGELDHHEARETLRSLEGLLDEYLPRDCALDLSGLSFMDSSGIALIVRLSRRVAESEASVLSRTRSSRGGTETGFSVGS